MSRYLASNVTIIIIQCRYSDCQLIVYVYPIQSQWCIFHNLGGRNPGKSKEYEPPDRSAPWTMTKLLDPSYQENVHFNLMLHKTGTSTLVAKRKEFKPDIRANRT